MKKVITLMAILAMCMGISSALGDVIYTNDFEGTVTIKDVNAEGAYSGPADDGKYLIPKGSVTLDGISLTVAELSEQTFKVAIIPHTFDNTIVSSWAVGGKVNIEFDMIGKYVVGYMDQAKINAA